MKSHKLICISIILCFAGVAANAQFPIPETLWNQTFSSSRNLDCNAIQQTSDGGYVLGGTVQTYTGFSTTDMLLIKINDAGEIQWQRNFGGPGAEECLSLVITTDGGYALGGWSSYDNLVPYLVKTDSLGNLQWEHTYGTFYSQCKSVQQTSDGGFILGGWKGPGWDDMYLIKTDPQGIMQWQRGYGGPYVDGCYSVCQTIDGGYILAGQYGIVNVNAYCWLVKTDPVGNQQWEQRFGGGQTDKFYSVLQTDDGGYIAGGVTQPPGPDTQMFLVKTDSSGNLIWENSFDANENWEDICYTVLRTPDKGFLLSGLSQLGTVKTDSSGNQLWALNFPPQYGNFKNYLCSDANGSYTIAGSIIYSDDILVLHIAGLEQAWVHLLPVNPPITIPAQGGSFQYTISLTNCGTVSCHPQVWVMVALPTGQSYGPVLGPISVLLDTAATISRLRTQVVPGSAPAGVYTYKAYVGAYQTAKWDSSSFTFTKSGVGIQDSGFGGWTCTGETFPGEEFPPLLRGDGGDLVTASPNPFNPTTTISFSLPEATRVTLKVYDTNGRQVAQLVNGLQPAGQHHVTFDGSSLPSGLYLYRLTAGQNTAAGKMVLLK
jgi:hypothetical protein